MFTLLLLAVSVIAVSLMTIYWFGGMLIPLFAGGAPYVPTPDKKVELMIKLAQVQSSDKVMDLGSGDGRLLIASVQAGAKRAIGYEIHHGLAKLSRHNIRKYNLQDKIHVFNKSFWNADVSGASLVLLYQIPNAMEKLGNKLRHQLPKGARVVSNGFEFPDWEPTESNTKVFLYIV